MQITVANNTSSTLITLGAAFYDGDGLVSLPPQSIAPRSAGDGGTLIKSGGTDGLWGLVAYTIPDETKTLIIWTPVPAATGSLGFCKVGLLNGLMATGDDPCPNFTL